MGLHRECLREVSEERELNVGFIGLCRVTELFQWLLPGGCPARGAKGSEGDSGQKPKSSSAGRKLVLPSAFCRLVNEGLSQVCEKQLRKK